MKREFYIFLFIIGIIASALTSVNAQKWEGWNYRRTVTIDNTSGSTLTDYQVKIDLSNLTPPFIFGNANSDGSDLRITSGDGETEIPFWIEEWNVSLMRAIIWVKVPSIPTPGGATVYLYYGNALATSVSNGDNTFEFFDDFEASVTIEPGYYAFGPASTLMVQDQSWESSAPHNLSVVEAPTGAAYTYYGYYGLQTDGGIGMAGSDDLLNWTKFPESPASPPNNPLFTGSGERWSSVFLDGSIYYMVHTRNYSGTSNVVYRQSTDGLNWTAATQVIPPVSGDRNQNPSLFHDPNDNQYYLYWFRRSGGMRRIMVRTASTVAGLTSASDVELLSTASTLAAPNMLYYDGTYFLSTEIFESVWKVRIYSGTTPVGPFTVLPGNPVLDDGCACLFQTLFSTMIYEYYCKETSGTWTLDMRVVDPSTGRIMYEQGEIDAAKWTSDGGGTWNALSDIEQDGTEGIVAEGSTSTKSILKSSFSGSDYILEGYGRQIANRVWGFGFRTTDAQNTYTLNIYEDLDGTNNLYLYKFATSGNALVWNTGLGAIHHNVWYKLTIKAYGSNFEVYVDDDLKTTTPAFDNSWSLGPIALFGESGTVAQFNDIRVRKYATLEPTTTVGEQEDNPLPVELSSFSGSVIGSSVKLIWQTETEVNNYGFDIERKDGDKSSNTLNWEKIGFVNGNGNSNSPKDYLFEDKTVTTGKYSYRLKQIDNDGEFEYSKAIEIDFGVPGTYELSQNNPNPFNPTTRIVYQLPEKGNVTLKVFDMLGKEIATLVEEYRDEGRYEVEFNASEFSSGAYFYRIQSGDYVETKKMILMK